MISTLDISFLDSDNNHKPNNTQENSENPSVCNASFWLTKEHAEGPIDDSHIFTVNRNKWLTNGRYMVNDGDVHKIEEAERLGERSPDRFSLDEAISVAATSRRYKHYENLKRIELFGRSYSLRPDTFSFLLLCKFPIFNLFLIPRFFVALSMVLACLSKPSDTSGKQLAYIRYRGLNMHLTWWICEKVLKNEDMHQAFRIWYPSFKNTNNIQHPTCDNTEKIWGKQ